MSQEMLYIYAPRVNNLVPFVSRNGVKKVPKVEKFEALNENDSYNEFENDDRVLADVQPCCGSVHINLFKELYRIGGYSYINKKDGRN